MNKRKKNKKQKKKAILEPRKNVFLNLILYGGGLIMNNKISFKNFFENLCNSGDLKKCENMENAHFISRFFGIFAEEIVKIWAENGKNEYNNLGKPSRYDKGNDYCFKVNNLSNSECNGYKYSHITYDFLFEKDNEYFIVEQKNELSYEKFKNMILNNQDMINDKMKKKSFKKFIEIPNNSIKFIYNNDTKYIKGKILIWGSITDDSEILENIKNEYGIYEIISLEKIIEDLIEWKDKSFIDFLKNKKQLVIDFIDFLSGN
jgi:hypothetical protein